MIMCNCNLIPPFSAFLIRSRSRTFMKFLMWPCLIHAALVVKSNLTSAFQVDGGQRLLNLVPAPTWELLPQMLWIWFRGCKQLWPKPKVWQKNSLTPTIILTHWRLIAKKPSVGLSRSPRPGFGKQGSNLRGCVAWFWWPISWLKWKVRIIAGHGELGATRAGGRFLTVAVSNWRDPHAQGRSRTCSTSCWFCWCHICW